MDDPISKALKRAQSENKSDQRSNNKSVRDWVRPESFTAPGKKQTRRSGNRTRQEAQEKQLSENLLELGCEVELDLEHLLRGNVLTGGDENPNIADRYKLLRTRIRQRMEPREWNRLGITSPAAKEGKSLSSINLAITAAREGRAPVVLIDADFRRPSLAKYLGLTLEKNLAQYLRGEAVLEEIVYRPSHQSNLLLIPNQLSSEAVNMSAGESYKHLTTLITELTAAGAFIIVDLPPTLVADDVLSIAPLLNTLIIVVREGQTNLNELEETTELLADFNLLGTILNDSSEGNNVYGYYLS